MDKRAHETKIRRLPGKETGKQRRELYKAAYEHIKKAMDARHFLEVVTICESIVGDRLGARLAQIRQQDVDARKLLTLERLVKCLAHAETDKEQLKLYEKVKSWAGQRNKVLHQMVKLSDDWNVPWEARVDEVKAVAEAGQKLTREVDNLLRKLNPYKR